jgi:hypothetical protein
MGNLLSTIADWLRKAVTKVVDTGKTIVESLPFLSPSPPSPANGGTGGGTSTPGNPGSGSSGGSALGTMFTETVDFLVNLTKKETWTRVGIVILGILLVVVAVRRMIRTSQSSGRISRILDQTGT